MVHEGAMQLNGLIKTESHIVYKQKINKLTFYTCFAFLHSSLDATFSQGLGRLVNDTPHMDANCSMKKILKNGHPRLVLFAKEVINPGEELRYDYGIKDLPWRKCKGMCQKFIA
jgi:hypothetical protein